MKLLYMIQERLLSFFMQKYLLHPKLEVERNVFFSPQPVNVTLLKSWMDFPQTCSNISFGYGIRTKHPPDITPPAHFGIGGRNPPQVFYRVDITPPATFDRVDKTPLVSFARWTKSPLSCGQNPPRTKSP